MSDFDPTKPVQTRDGRKASVVCHDLELTDCPVAARVTFSDGGEDIIRYRKDGKCFAAREDCVDLVNTPVDVEVPTHLNEPTMRDLFAMSALTEITTSVKLYPESIFMMHARLAYQYADAMLVARKQELLS